MKHEEIKTGAKLGTKVGETVAYVVFKFGSFAYCGVDLYEGLTMEECVALRGNGDIESYKAEGESEWHNVECSVDAVRGKLLNLRTEADQTEATIPEADLDEAVAEEVQKELDAERDGFTITKNEQFGSVEVSFNEKPSAEIRDALKLLRFRWHGQRGIWYGYRDEATVRDAILSACPELKKGEAKQTKADKAKKPEKVNKFGVKVGDFFSASWGYEQTNADFFQVVALVGESSVRVREVNPPIIEDKATGPMACDRVYDIRNTGELLPPSPSSVFIKDQERGDLKRLKSYNADGSNPQFFLSSFTDAHYCVGDTEKMYESWYY